MILSAVAFSSAAYAQQTGPGPQPDPWSFGPSLSLFYNNGGITLGSPAGGQQGVGTINVSGGFFKNGAAVGLTIGSPITGTCTNGFGLFNNAGVLGCTSLTGGGSVTSVAMTVPSIMAVSGSPITGSGTLGVTLANETANTVFAAPNGSTGTPTFRALVAADLPSVPASTITGTLGVANGGTGATTFTANAPLIGNGTSAIGLGTRSGNTTVFGTASGTLTNGHCVQIDANGNFVDAGGSCTVGGGGGTVSSASINQLAWYSSAGTTVVGLATANNGILVTSAGGVPSISSTIPAATQANITGTGTLASGTTASGFNVACVSEPARTGDVTASSGSCANTIANNAVTYGKFQTVAASSLVGNSSGSTANAGGITLGSALTFSGTALQTTAMSGDITTPANSFVTTLATVNANTGTFGSASLVPVITVNGKGLITSVTTASVASCGNLTGDITSVGCATTLPTVNTNTGSFGSSTSIPNFTVNGKGLIVAAGSNVVIAPAGTLSGTTLNSGVTASSLTSVGTLTSLGLTGASTHTQSIGATSTDGVLLTDPTAATVGAQKWSPRVHFTGQGWKTNATAGSQTVDVIEELQPVQGAASPSGNLVISSQVNGGGYGALLTLPTGGGLNLASGTYQIGGSQIAFSNIASTVGCAQLPSLTGDITSSSCATTLATVNANTGSFGSSTAIPTFTVNGKGLITAASTNAVVAPAGTLTGSALAAGVTSSSLTSLGTISGLVVTGSLTATGLVTNADLVNSGTTVNGVLCTLGSTCSITAVAAAGTLTGTTLAANVVNSSLTSVGTLAGLTVTGSLTATGLVTNGDLVNSGTTVNGALCTLGSSCTVTAAAGTLTGSTLASGVTASSLTGVGTLTSGGTGTGFTLALGTSTLTGTLPVNHGGTGATTFTSSNPLIGNGTSAVAQGSRSGNTTGFVTFTGATTTGQCMQYDANGNAVAAPCGAGVPPVEHGGRLTLQNGVPVMTTSQANTTTLYYAPYTSAFVAIYNGSTFSNYQFTSGPSDNTGLSLGTFGSGWAVSSVYDVFVTLSGGVPVLCTGPAWTNFNTRSAAGSVGKFNNIYVNSNASAMTCRTSNAATINVAQNQGTYLGTIATTTSGLLTFVYGGGASGGSPGILYVWNYYNRVLTSTYNFDTAAAYTFKGSTPSAANWRQANASSNNRIYFIVGQIEDACTVWYQSFDAVVGATGAFALTGIVINIAGVPAGSDVLSAGALWAPGTTALQGVTSTNWPFTCNPVGLDWIQAVEAGDGNNNNSFGIFGGNQLNFTYPM